MGFFGKVNVIKIGNKFCKHKWQIIFTKHRKGYSGAICEVTYTKKYCTKCGRKIGIK